MTSVISIRAKPAKVARIDARAAKMGFDDRSKYILALIDQDLAGTSRPHSFASEDLVGVLALGRGSATNKNTRRVMARRLKRGSRG